MTRNHLALFSIALAACGDATASTDLPPRASCAIAVVGSDYRSTTISLLTGDAERCAPDVVTSGSRPPGLLTALSGDVVLPSEADPSGLVHLIDRYPNAVITTLDPVTDQVVTQLAVSPGYPANPQDITYIGQTPLVSLLERPALADRTTTSTDLLLRTDPPRTIDLGAFADAGLDPMPTRFARAAGRLWIGLTHLDADFERAGPGRVLALDPDSLEVSHRLDLAPLTNCGHIASAGDAMGLWIVCSGLFRDSPDGPRIERSGLAWRSPELGQTDLTPTWSRAATELGAALGFTLAALDDERALVVALGDLVEELPDRLLLVSRTAGHVTVLAEGGAFELGDVLPLPGAGLFLVADADPRDPRIRRFEWPDAEGSATELAPVRASNSGLPPRHLARFR